MRDRPTLAELRIRVHKGRHREIGNWLARHWARPTAVYGTWLAVRLGMSAHQVTILSLLASLGGAVGIGTGNRWGFVAGTAQLFLGFWLDRVDGQVARWRRTESLDGVYFDYLMHHATNLALGFALGYGLAARTGELGWTIAGFFIAAGWCGLSLHNDCRYKAFFQRLKRSPDTYLVHGGAGGRPSPPAPWPRRWPGIVAWPSYKLCEGHVVLGCLGVLALMAIVVPTVWLRGWQGYLLLLAALAPSLSIARSARAICANSAEIEFAAWFQKPREDEMADERIHESEIVAVLKAEV